MSKRKNRITKHQDYISLHIVRRNGERYEAKVDADDYPSVANTRWYCCAGRCNSRYACNERNRVRHMLHRTIYGEVPEDMEVSFLNGDTFDCRRANLILTTHLETTQSRRLKKKQGVFLAGDGRWRVSLSFGGRRYQREAKTREEAVELRDRLLKEHGLEIRDGRRVRLPVPACPANEPGRE